eukprot:2580090-Prymnesium_polylepis.1
MSLFDAAPLGSARRTVTWSRSSRTIILRMLVIGHCCSRCSKLCSRSVLSASSSAPSACPLKRRLLQFVRSCVRFTRSSARSSLQGQNWRTSGCRLDFSLMPVLVTSAVGHSCQR